MVAPLFLGRSPHHAARDATDGVASWHAGRAGGGSRETPMLARQLLIGFLAVIVPSTIVLGAVTFYSLTAMRRLSDEFVEITHSDEAVTDPHMTLTQAGTPLGFFLLTGNPAHRRRVGDLILAAAERPPPRGAPAPHHPD